MNRTSPRGAGGGARAARAPRPRRPRSSRSATSAPTPTPSCPTSPCEVISRTTAFQTRDRRERKTCSSRRADGRIVAWTITLGKPGQEAADVLRGEPRRRRAGRHHACSSRATAATAACSAQSPLAAAHAVLRPDRAVPARRRRSGRRRATIVALTVPTWAPALGARPRPRQRLAREPRRRRVRRHADAERADRRAATSTRYKCAYRTARLTYSATLITTPVPPEARARAEAPPSR